MQNVDQTSVFHRLRFTSYLLLIGLFSVGLASCRNGSGLGGGKGKVSFDSEIKPLLARNCVKCHLGVAKSARGGKAPDFRTREGAFAEYAGGTLIVPGSSADSRLFKVVSSTDYGTMPPDKHILTPAQVDLLRRWIDQGARWPKGESGLVTPVQ